MADELKMQLDLAGLQRFLDEYPGRAREAHSRMVTSILNPLTGERVVVDLAKERGRLRQRVSLQPLPLGDDDDEVVVLPCDVEPGSS